MSTLKIAVGPDDHAQGDEHATCTLVEYGDYECPHCATAVPIVVRLQEHFGGKLQLIFRNFPLTQIHPQAQAAAETAEFAGSLGKFWEMHDLLFENQENLGLDLYAELARSLELDTRALEQALEGETFSARVRADFSGGVRSGVNGTPTFFINGQRHNGPFDYEHLSKAIHTAVTA